MLAAISWCGLLLAETLAAAATGLAKRGLPLEGWHGTPAEQVIGWTLLTTPYVFVVWLPVAIGAVAVTGLLNLSRRSWVALSVVLATALLRGVNILRT
jgi:hypothetical protein